MNLPYPIRLLLAVLISLGVAALLLVLFYATELAFDVWDRLRQAPITFLVLYGGVILLLSGAVVWVIWRLLRRRSSGLNENSARRLEALTEADLQARIEKADPTQIDVSTAHHELQTLRKRRRTGKIHVALFGEINTGKSSLIKALLPHAMPVIDPRGGTTRRLVQYNWTSPDGEELILTDMPGLNEAEGVLSPLSQEEAQRAHVVIYLVDGDLTRDQYDELQELLALDKPVILALNKMDRYGAEDLAALRARLLVRVGDAHDIEIVSVSAGARREVIKVHADGREEVVVQNFPPQVEDLRAALQARISHDLVDLECLRDRAVLQLATRKFDDALCVSRRARCKELIAQYTRKAVLGALVAISPGTDLIIQGYLGVGLVRSLCEVYQVPTRDVDITRFLELATKNVGKTLPLLLAVSGNALKAFPGLGTVAGGLLHAVGYGLIFESLGRAVAASLDQSGTLTAASTLRLFEEKLSDDLEARARRLAQLVVAQRRERDKDR